MSFVSKAINQLKCENGYGSKYAANKEALLT